ncbi:MAG: hypothetical protein IJV75_00295 [Alphaproteobacteria bacterium]|nr:hypothetical protein [Alphaproteobacteria bacterium]
MQEKIYYWERKVAQARIKKFSDLFNVHKYKFNQSMELIKKNSSLENLAELYRCICTIKFLPVKFKDNMPGFHTFCEEYKIYSKVKFKRIIAKDL